ncbi:hypothetical protein [Thalassomonas actiniarum]|uniref:Uncharacterized protein n=1 Tax=Thalassomonas actiniarum TaxID=485447 RepID=A0AAF0C6V1_9GAMM|nr:hypothetical protein [Thalassomonas actiniarum]WDE02686.1 hypothetical protein SG35_030260 [Thalassomonas actiniarum]
MMTCFFWLVVATLAVQVPNILGIQSQSNGETLTVLKALKITLLTLPVTIVATTGYTMFYGRGVEYFSYPAMSVYAKLGALVMAIILQFSLLQAKNINWVEVCGLLICILGFLVSINSEMILERIR